MSIDIKLYVASVISAAIYGKDLKITDADFFDEIRDDARDNVSDEADSACIYYANAMDIIDRYESEYGNDVEDTGEEFKAEDWQNAMRCYAKGIAYAAIAAGVESEIDSLVEAYDNLVETLPDDMPVTMGTECIHGWAAHAEETSEGVLVWHKLDGDCEARAIQSNGFWLTATWTPGRTS